MVSTRDSHVPDPPRRRCARRGTTASRCVTQRGVATTARSPGGTSRRAVVRHTHQVHIGLAGLEDVAPLARLLWLHAAPEEQAQRSVADFTVDLGAWWSEHAESHLAFVARRAVSEVVGMAWLALVPRVPRPGVTTRCSADIQSVFVLPEHRRQRIGSALVRAASEHALRVGAGRVTVQAGRTSLPVYERLGFAASPQLLQWPKE